MAGILGLDGVSPAQLQDELARGGRFVVFEYCVSSLVKTALRSTDVYFVRAGQGTFGMSLGFTLRTMLFGWWAFPWGLVYSARSLVTNLSGGKDVTEQVMEALLAPPYIPGETG
jgi:hypothetical protein